MCVYLVVWMCLLTTTWHWKTMWLHCILASCTVWAAYHRSTQSFQLSIYLIKVNIGALDLHLMPTVKLEILLFSLWTGGGSETEPHILGLLLFISTHSQDVPAVLNFSSTYYFFTSFLLHLCLVPAALSPFSSRGNNLFMHCPCLPRCNINVH